MTDDSLIVPLVGEVKGTQKNGIGVMLAAVFVVGTMCGSGILAIPQAIVNSGWIGIPVLATCGVLSAYTGTLLGRCWTVIRARYPEYNNQNVTDPYPIIGFRAAGRAGLYATRICMNATLFGGATVFVLLISENLTNLVKALGHDDFSSCYILIIVILCMIPITWLGTPDDFWQVGVVACVTTSIGAILIVVGIIQDASIHENADQQNPTIPSFLNAFGIILYSFGGSSCYPTIQVDMRKPDRFPTAVKLGVGAALVMYLFTGVSGFVVFGSDMKPNVLSALSHGWVSYTINILITAHLLMAYVIISNPVTQDIEGFFGLNKEFSWRRALIRTAYGLLILFVAQSIPHFSIILSLIGGSTVACANFIFPPLFYLLLSRQDRPQKADSDGHAEENCAWMAIDITLPVKVILIEIIVIGAVGGILSTFFAFASLINGQSGFTVPCYVNPNVGL